MKHDASTMGPAPPEPNVREVRIERLEEILQRCSTLISPEDHKDLSDALQTLIFVTRELESKDASISRLQRLLLGWSTEEASRLSSAQRTNEQAEDGSMAAQPGAGEQTNPGSPEQADQGKPKKKRKGHGRNAAALYVGAEQVIVAHEKLRHGDVCPGCQSGKVLMQHEPGHIVRVKGVAPLSATVYNLQRLRCSTCQELFSAAPPPGVGEEKYDETARSMLALLKYGCGLPMARLSTLQKNLGIPLPDTTQWEQIEQAADKLQPAFDELVLQAACGDVLHNDDTKMKVLELRRLTEAQAEQDSSSSDKRRVRTGIYTTGIFSTRDGNQIALFFTGAQHAGENLADVLKNRDAALDPPVQMCDALSANTTGPTETIVANCLAHARRKFADLADSFPEQCRFVLDAIRQVYDNEQEAKLNSLSPADRLALHQSKSAPLMERLKLWFAEQLEQKKVEPNSSLGKAIAYMQKHWDELTLFLRHPHAPLDNNAVERALKKAVLHRKNAMFYKTGNGAKVGDLFMSLIHSAELAKVNPFDYLVALQRQHQALALAPSEWMPWNFQETLARLASLSGPSP